MTSTKIYQVGFIILILINAVLIFLLTQKPQRPPMNHVSRESPIIEKISSQLELTEDQFVNYRSMAKQHGDQIRIFEENHRVLLKAYLETLVNTSISSPDSIKNEILKIELAKLQYTYQHFEELKSILDEPQKDRFNLIVKDILVVLIGEKNKLRPPPRD